MVHRGKDLRNSWRIWGESQPTSSPRRPTNVGHPDCVGAGGAGSERIHPRRIEEIEVYLIDCKGEAGRTEEERLLP